MLSRIFTRKKSTRDEGDAAEKIAESYLQQQGLKTESKNYHCRHGEIDLVMRDGEVLVFVEVRMRRGSGFGGARESIHSHKQQRIILAAQHYLARLKTMPPCRFDVVLLNQLDVSAVEWIKNAFES